MPYYVPIAYFAINRSSSVELEMHPRVSERLMAKLAELFAKGGRVQNKTYPEQLFSQSVVQKLQQSFLL